MSDYDSDPRLNIINVAEKCGIKIVGREGSRVLAICPFCNDKTGHLYLTPYAQDNNRYTNVYRCAKCGSSGSAIKLYAITHNLSTKEAFKELVNDDIETSLTNIKKFNIKNNEDIKLYEIASLIKRDEVYTSLLSKLDLESHHIDDLINRGLTLEVINKNKYKSIPQNVIARERICSELIKEGHVLAGIPGFYKNSRKKWDFYAPQGFFIPVRSYNNSIQGMQIRFDIPKKFKYKWFSSSKMAEGTKINGFIHLRWNKNGISDKVVITEGPLKADVASYLSDTTFIGVPGVGSYKGIEKILYLLKPKQIYIAYDMDYIKNSAVKMQYEKFTAYLKEKNISYLRCAWNPEHKGIDDYLYHIKCDKERRYAAI